MKLASGASYEVTGGDTGLEHKIAGSSNAAIELTYAGSFVAFDELSGSTFGYHLAAPSVDGVKGSALTAVSPFFPLPPLF